jgi:hypothetical protein
MAEQIGQGTAGQQGVFLNGQDLVFGEVGGRNEFHVSIPGER